MKTRETLPPEITWQSDRHVTDVVITAVADGEGAIVPQPALRHVELCEACTQRVGQAALLSLQAGAMVQQLGPSDRVVRGIVRRPLPIRSIGVAIGLAAVGMIPQVLQAPQWLGQLSAGVVRDLPLLVRSAALILRTAPGQLAPTLAVLSFGSAMVLVVMGTVIARTVPRALPVKGGAQ